MARQSPDSGSHLEMECGGHAALALVHRHDEPGDDRPGANFEISPVLALRRKTVVRVSAAAACCAYLGVAVFAAPSPRPAMIFLEP